jgi:ADP-ribose pyrophosphatase YjhB (NUDIX family)
MAAFRVPHHQVSVAAVIGDEHDRVLLAEHRLRVPSLSVPGGFVGRGEQPEEALRREVREEVGLELAQVSLSFVQTLISSPQMEITFRCRAAGAPVVDGLEIVAAHWVPLSELPAEMHPDERERILRALGRDARVRPAPADDARPA